MPLISGYEIRCFILFFQIFGDLNKTIYICQTIFEANHNKDYSVVKTFKAGITSVVLAFVFFKLRPTNQNPHNPRNQSPNFFSAEFSWTFQMRWFWRESGINCCLTKLLG